MERTSFIFYKEWKDAISDLPVEVRLEIYEAVMEYAFSGVSPQLSQLATVAFAFIKQDIDRSLDNYQRITDRNKINGQKGGRPSKTHNNPQNPLGFTETQKTLYDNVNDIITTTIPDGIDSSSSVESKEDILLAKIPETRAREEVVEDNILPPVVDIQTGIVCGDGWRNDFGAYQSTLRQCYMALRKDAAWLAERKRLNPRVDILLTLEKVCVDYWATHEGWQRKKGNKGRINWRTTLATSIGSKFNQVYENGSGNNQIARGTVSDEFRKEILEGIGAI